MDPEDRVLLGSLSKRREHNIRWRFFQNEWKKVYPPLAVPRQHPAHHTNLHTPPRAPLNFGDQSFSPLQDLLVLAGLPSPDPSSKGGNQQGASPFDGGLPVRWLRRRYQALLGRIPLLIARPSPPDNSKCTYDVLLAKNAISTSKPHPSRLRFVDVENVLWMSDINPIVQSNRHRK